MSSIELRQVLLGTVVLVAACNAHVSQFDVQPRHVCTGQVVTISWDVSGSAYLSVGPKNKSDVPASPVPSRGQTTITPTASTHVSLHVTRWLGEPTIRAQDVDVVSATPVEIAGSLAGSSCNDGVLTVATEAKGFGSDVRASLVSATKRALDVRHRGMDGRDVAASVVPGSPSGAFANLPIDGHWTLSTRLGPDESCASPPHVLTAMVSPSCQGGAP